MSLDCSNKEINCGCLRETLNSDWRKIFGHVRRVLRSYETEIVSETQQNHPCPQATGREVELGREVKFVEFAKHCTNLHT